jgi:hypothetical protein
MDQTLKDIYDGLEERLDKLEDDYTSGNIDASSFAGAVMATRLEKKMVPYHEELQRLDVKIYGHFGLIINLLSSRHLTPKEEQQVKEKLSEIKRTFNEFESCKDEKERNTADAFAKIEKLLIEFTGLGNNEQG